VCTGEGKGFPRTRDMPLTEVDGTRPRLGRRFSGYRPHLRWERVNRRVILGSVAGEPSHFELGVPDAVRAKAFYGELLGWSFETTSGENAWIVTPGVRGGLHDEDDAANIVLYFRIDDIDAAVRRVRELGGEAGEPGPAEQGGRYVSCRDDQGVVFGLHQPD
jgi:uncharacterized protein